MHKNKIAVLKFTPFSIKQKKVLTWWMEGSPHCDKDAIICDGAVRSGKTLIMSLSFMVWSLQNYDGCNFGMAGKTIGSFKRNVWFWLKIMLISRGYNIAKMSEMGENVYAISHKGHTNYYYMFSGRDERSQDLVQGITVAGFFFDEVALMPQSFVTQACARCSVEGAKLWFNCNPEGPYHWFKVEWIDKAKEKYAYHLHFVLDDNPSLSDRVKQRYHRMFSGIFYERFILGLWVLANGVIYSMFDKEKNLWDDQELEDKLIWDTSIMRYIAIDYGTTNPMVFLDIYDDHENEVLVRDEYYWNSKKKGRQKTDSEYADDLEAFIAEVEKPIVSVIIDPSAASFRAELTARGIPHRAANNEVLDGIRMTATALQLGLLRIHKRCKHLTKEMMSYVWDEKAAVKRGVEQPVKENDHGPDALRYFVATILRNWRMLYAKEQRKAA